jgi:hypothetical protein
MPRIMALQKMSASRSNYGGTSSMRISMRTLSARVFTVTTTALLCGCAMNPQPPALGQPRATAAPVPRVQNCAVLNTGTPSRFVCDGKVYTSFQLAKLREDEAKKYASGK